MTINKLLLTQQSYDQFVYDANVLGMLREDVTPFTVRHVLHALGEVFLKFGKRGPDLRQ
jgi:hypothetical protein